MKTAKVPKASFSVDAAMDDKIEWLNRNGTKLKIDTINWTEFPKSIPVSVRIGHNNRSIFLFYEVKGEQLRAVNTEDFGSVWEDSCVEFFVQREGEKQYRNFECNALGALLASSRENRENAEKLSSEQMASIVRQSAIQHYYENGKQLSDWTLFLEIPKTVVGFSTDEALSGNRVRANFYKCGDKTTEPHFITWNAIDLPKPDFHQPVFFGHIEFE